MAAGGFKEFVAGEVLDEDEINDFLMQGVLVFAGTAARGSAIGTAVEGQFAFLKDSDQLTYYSGSAWEVFESGEPAAVVSATTGSPTLGTVVSGGDTFDTYLFTGDGSITFSSGGLIDLLVLSGGGGGGSNDNDRASGGGAAGAFIRLEEVVVAAGTVTVGVGAGGAAGTDSSLSGAIGGSSRFGLFIALPGGGGGGGSSGAPLRGSSGGGNGAQSSSQGAQALALVPAVGNNGGTGFGSGTVSLRAGGGGGGQGAVGSNGASGVGGAGGAGVASDITGSSLFYAGGGGGGQRTGTAAQGGSSVGGNGGVGTAPGTAGAANRGSGGGSGGNASASSGAPGAGSSGVVIVRVKV